MDYPEQLSQRTSSVLPALVKLLRPKQWLKNGFVLAPLIFAGAFFDITAINNALLATLLFCITSSIVYIVNDIHDIEYDQTHPTKSKTRPLASGEITVVHTIPLLFLLAGIITVGFYLLPNVIPAILSYLALNLAYTLVLKHKPVVDIFCIALGFVLRVYAGAQAIGVPVSSWMFITTLCLALFLAAIKRRQELLLYPESASREILQFYKVELIDRYANMAATCSIVFYSLYVMTDRPQLIISIPFVMFGLFRYWFIVEVLGEGESPTDVLVKDWQLALTVIVWISVCVYVLSPLAN